MKHQHHDHNHHHHSYNPATGNRFLWAIGINLLYVAAEFYLGFRYDSVGLLADAGHNLSDVGGLIVSLAAFWMQKKSPDHLFTYGFKKATVLAAFINSVLLLLAVALIVFECIEKFRVGSIACGSAIMITAGIGILINGLTVALLAKGKEKDINIKSAYLHMLADALVSLGVVISGGLITITGFAWFDPVVGLGIAAIIVCTSWNVFKESIVLILDGVPHGIDYEHLKLGIAGLENVKEIHKLHIWALSTTDNALTAHVVLKNISLQERTKETIKHFLQQQQIHHSTLEFESAESVCSESD